MKVKIEVTDQGEQHKSIKITGNDVTPWDTYEGKAVLHHEDGSSFFMFENDDFIHKLEDEIGIGMDEVFLFLESDKTEDQIRCDDIFPPKKWEMQTEHKEALTDILSKVIADRLGLDKMSIENGEMIAYTKDGRKMEFDEIDDLKPWRYDLTYEWDLYQCINKTGDHAED